MCEHLLYITLPPPFTIGGLEIRLSKVFSIWVE